MFNYIEMLNDLETLQDFEIQNDFKTLNDVKTLNAYEMLNASKAVSKVGTGYASLKPFRINSSPRCFRVSHVIFFNVYFIHTNFVFMVENR